MSLKALATRAIFAAAIALVGISGASAQNIETGFLNRTVVVGRVQYRYQVYVHTVSSDPNPGL